MIPNCSPSTRFLHGQRENDSKRVWKALEFTAADKFFNSGHSEQVQPAKTLLFAVLPPPVRVAGQAVTPSQSIGGTIEERQPLSRKLVRTREVACFSVRPCCQGRVACLDQGCASRARGSTTFTRHPFLSACLRSSIDPPCFSAIWRESTRPIPVPSGLVV